MEEVLIKVKDEKESFFLKELLKKLKVKFESLSYEENVSGEKVYDNNDTQEFKKINRKDIWK